MKKIHQLSFSTIENGIKYIKPKIKTWRQRQMERETMNLTESLPDCKINVPFNGNVDTSILKTIISDPNTTLIPTGILQINQKEGNIDLNNRLVIMTDHVNDKILWLIINKKYDEAIDLLDNMTIKCK